jgi:hypothetical protein
MKSTTTSRIVFNRMSKTGKPSHERVDGEGLAGRRHDCHFEDSEWNIKRKKGALDRGRTGDLNSRSTSKYGSITAFKDHWHGNTLNFHKNCP